MVAVTVIPGSRLPPFPGPGCRTGPGDPASHPPRSAV